MHTHGRTVSGLLNLEVSYFIGLPKNERLLHCF